MNLNDLKTPRPMPEDLEDWSPEIESLLSEWGEISLCFSYLHNYSQRKYKKKFHHLQIPIIILSTLTGTANFAADSYVPTDYKQGFSAGVGSLNIFCGILGTLLSFLRYSEVYEGHRISALAWSKLGRAIEIELSLHDKKRKPCREFLKVCRAEYDNLLESSPSIDLDIIGMFNKKFEGKYPTVSRPLVCNGLKTIRPFNSSPCPQVDDKKDEETGEANPNMVYETEPEPEPDNPPLGGHPPRAEPELTTQP